MTAMIRAGAGALLACLLAGCATTNMGTPGDPLERMNRATHKFNDAVDRGVLKPVAKAYLKYLPEPIRNGIDNVLENLAFPTTIVNDLLQLKLKDSLVDLGRFTVNTTLGIGGIFDPASSIGMSRNDEDFGQTLGRWGVPAGPYLVLPLLGPSTMRDAPSIVVDGYTDIRTQAHLNDTEQWSLGVLSIVHRRSELLPFDPSFDAAYDRYAFIRNAWLQRREYQVKDGEVSDEISPEELEALDEEMERESKEQSEGEAPESPPDQPPPSGASSSATSLMPASEAIAGGTLR